MTIRPIIALDCDGVLLNYNLAYPAAWKAAFGEELQIKLPDAYHPYNMYDCRFESDPGRKAKLYEHTIGEFWATMPLLENVKESCDKLVDMGYDLICITSMSPEFTEYRIKNFVLHNLPIKRTYAVKRDKSLPRYNPKRQFLIETGPVAFVDDTASNFLDLDDLDIHKALIYRNQPDSPSAAYLHLADTIHPNLADFVELWETTLMIAA